MPKKNEDLHGAAPDKCEVTLLLVDFINPLDFPEASELLRYLPAMTQKISRLKQRAQQADVPAAKPLCLKRVPFTTWLIHQLKTLHGSPTPSVVLAGFAQ